MFKGFDNKLCSTGTFESVTRVLMLDIITRSFEKWKQVFAPRVYYFGQENF